MFRLSDPLGNYAQDPRSTTKTPARISPSHAVPPTVTQPSSKTPYLIVVIVLLIASLLLLFTLRSPKISDLPDRNSNTESLNFDTKCVECFELDKISRISVDPETAGNYLKDKLRNISKSATINLDTETPLVSYTKKLEDITKVQEKVNQMTVLKGELERLVAESNAAEKTLNVYREGYEKKIKEVEELGNKSLSNTMRVKEQKKIIVEAKRAVESLNLDIDVADKSSKERKKAFYAEIERINSEIQSKIREAGVDEDNIERIVREKEDRIREMSSQEGSCRDDIQRRMNEINRLKRENQTHSNELFDVEYLFKQKRLEIHNLETANKLGEVLKQLEGLRNSSANAAKPYLDEILESLIRKQKEYDEIAYRWAADEHRKNALASLRNIIEREQDLLKTWGIEQLKAWRLSKEEEKNITNSINTLKKTITSDLAELENLIQRKNNVMEELKRISRLIAEEQRAIDECQVVVARSEGKLRDIRRETEKLKNLMDTVQVLREQIKKRNAQFMSEEGSKDSISELFEQRSQLLEKAKQADKEVEKAGYEVVNYSNSMNELLKKGPTERDMKREVESYKEKRRLIDETDGKMKAIAEEIRYLLEY